MLNNTGMTEVHKCGKQTDVSSVRYVCNMSLPMFIIVIFMEFGKFAKEPWKIAL